MLGRELQVEIGNAVAVALAPTEVLGVTLEEGQDHGANDVIFVTVNLPTGTGPLPGTDYMRAMSAVSQALLRSNDERVPLFRTVREGELDPTDVEMDRAS